MCFRKRLDGEVWACEMGIASCMNFRIRKLAIREIHGEMYRMARRGEKCGMRMRSTRRSEDCGRYEHEGLGL